MSQHIVMSYSAITGTAAGLGRSAAGQSLIADRPNGIAGGQGLGFNGGELLAAALGGCFWNDLHAVADAQGVRIEVQNVDADIALAGNPPRVVRAHIAARLTGHDAPILERLFEAACEASIIASSLQAAFPITFERLSGDPN